MGLLWLNLNQTLFLIFQLLFLNVITLKNHIWIQNQVQLMFLAHILKLHHLVLIFLVHLLSFHTHFHLKDTFRNIPLSWLFYILVMARLLEYYNLLLYHQRVSLIHFLCLLRYIQLLLLLSFQLEYIHLLQNSQPHLL